MTTMDAAIRENLTDAQRALVEAANLLDLAATRARETWPEAEETLEEYTTAIDELRRELEADVLTPAVGTEDTRARFGLRPGPPRD